MRAFEERYVTEFAREGETQYVENNPIWVIIASMGGPGMSERRDWVLIALAEAPLDRIHLMKALFLLAARTESQIPGFFTFRPYMYGPYSFDLYGVLENLETDGLVTQSADVDRWSDYYLTNQGREEAARARLEISPDLARKLEDIVREIQPLSFKSLLAKVYTEAPEYAKNSVVKSRILQ